MAYPNIALLGRARAGKDTVASRLVQRHDYARVAFADPLKDMALKTDPIVDDGNAGYRFQFARLSEVVNAVGWERAKDEYPEVRRLLQLMGQSARKHDHNFWVRIALGKLDLAAHYDMPVVVTDVRYQNEADALRARGFKMVRVLRPERRPQIDTHDSEQLWRDYPADVDLINDGSIDNLHTYADSLIVTR